MVAELKNAWRCLQSRSEIELNGKESGDYRADWIDKSRDQEQREDQSSSA